MIVACVRTGEKYPIEYVYRLKAAVSKYLPVPHKFVCITDIPSKSLMTDQGITPVSANGLSGWWAKMRLFDPSWRKGEKVLYFDLDTVICDDITELSRLDIHFGICENFTRASGNKTWPCRYGSCCMVIGPDFDGKVWDAFQSDVQGFISRAGLFGDQKVIEVLIPAASILQDCLPKGYFLGYRNLTDKQPKDAKLVIFAGNSKPHTCKEQWIKEAWALS